MKRMSNDIAILICTEKGPLEGQAKLFVRSLRKYGGKCANVPIYSFQPRKGTEIAQETLDFFNDHGVMHITETMNTQYVNYGIANKMIIGAWAEKNLSHETLVFTDTDTFFMNEPDGFQLDENFDIGVRPCNHSGREGDLATAGPGDLYHHYWKELLEHFQLENKTFVRTVVNDTKVYSHYSGGIVVTRKKAGFFSSWLHYFEEAMKNELYPKHFRGIYHMDEVSLTLALLNYTDRILLLDDRYNYLPFLRDKMVGHGREANLEDLVHIHYRFYLQLPGYLEGLMPPLDQKTERFQWLKKQLPLSPTLEEVPIMKFPQHA